KKVWAKGLVNAVLRNFSRQQVALVKALEQDQTTILNYPAWWISKVQKQYPEHWQQILLTGNQHPPMTLRVNQSQLTGLAYQQKLQAANISSQLLDTQTLLLDQAIHVTDLPGFNEGEVSVQDYAAQMTARCLDAQANMRVLDACAAPGGKTCHILETAQVQMWALDVSEQRLARVNSNLQRLNLQAHTQVADVAKTDAWWDGQLFDRILLDAPCTASGVVRRHVDIKWLRRESDISSFAAQQKEMLQALWSLLKQGGKLLYVTCSIFAEENELQINNFLQTHADALHLPLLELPHNLQIQKGQFIPNEYHDGLFYALLQKH
ncbi:MAG: 16S rRNA (cytosine(967)-C(5))-methyltransferase RsmB, partial [Methylophilaceae bacterium]